MNAITSLSFKTRVVLAVIVEIAYMAASRYFYSTYAHDLAAIELARTPFRLVAALAFWLLLRDVIFRDPPDTQPLRRPIFGVGVAFLLLAALFESNYVASAGKTAIVLLATVPVGMHEELFFRGILQNTLIARFGFARGLALATLCFTAFHIGITPDDIFNYVGIALTGLALGVIYFRTKSMLTVICLHALYDALASIPPLFGPPMLLWEAVCLALSLWLFFKWAEREAPPGLGTRS